MRLRGRKSFRENLERQKDLIVLEPQLLKGRWNEFFGNDNPIRIECGMGKGQFIGRQSANNPDVNFIGMDMYDELLSRASEKARAMWKTEKNSDDVPNLALVRGNVEFLENMFEDGELERVYRQLQRSVAEVEARQAPADASSLSDEIQESTERDRGDPLQDGFA